MKSVRRKLSNNRKSMRLRKSQVRRQTKRQTRQIQHRRYTKKRQQRKRRIQKKGGSNSMRNRSGATARDIRAPTKEEQARKDRQARIQKMQLEQREQGMLPTDLSLATTPPERQFNNFTAGLGQEERERMDLQKSQALRDAARKGLENQQQELLAVTPHEGVLSSETVRKRVGTLGLGGHKKAIAAATAGNSRKTAFSPTADVSKPVATWQPRGWTKPVNDENETD